jgi:hypothetical protein
MAMGEKTYRFSLNFEDKTIVVEDRTCRFSFLLIMKDDIPVDPWIGPRILSRFIDKRGFATVREMSFLNHLEAEAKSATKAYLKRKYENYKAEEAKNPKLPYWVK